MRRIGHRGCAGQFPENTVAAIRGCAPHVDMVEIDVRRCGSGEIIVFHDETLDRLTEATGRVANHSLAELSKLTIAESTEGIPTLATVVDGLPPDTGLNVELKEKGMASEISSILSDVEDLIVSSFERDALAELPANLPRAYLTSDQSTEVVGDAEKLGCEFLHPHHELVEAELVARAHSNDIEVNTWTITDQSVFRSVRQAGVDGVIIDSWTVLPD